MYPRPDAVRPSPSGGHAILGRRAGRSAHHPAYAHELVDLLVDRQAADVVLLDLTQLNAFADYFIVATVDNVRQARAIADLLTEHVKLHDHRIDFEGDPESGWLLVDAGEGIFVHLFSLESRAYYNLEGLWSRTSGGACASGTSAPRVSPRQSRSRNRCRNAGTGP